MVKSQHHTSDQHKQLLALRDYYDPPRAADTMLTVVDESWFSAIPPIDETQLAAVCWFEMLTQKEQAQ